MAIDGSRSNFTADNNYTIDTFIEMFELSSTDAQNVREWKQLKAIADTEKTDEQKTKFKELTTLLSQKIVTSEDWNKLCDCMVNLEKMYVDKGLDKIQTTVEEYVESYTEETKLNETINNKVGTSINNMLLTNATQIIINKTQPEVKEGALWIKPKTTA
jgi:frataxin-like iron-binding protein CyaY